MGKEGGRKEEPGKVVFKTDMMSLQEPDKVDLRHCCGALHCHQGGYFTVTHKHSTEMKTFPISGFNIIILPTPVWSKNCDTDAVNVTPVMSWCMLASFQVSKILNIY